MFQTFDATTSPDQAPPRLAKLREELKRSGVDGFLVPRADVHQGEYVAARDERLAWLTGFTGSAGFCAVLKDRAGLFVDGRYRVQARQQCSEEITPVPWPETQLSTWLISELGSGKIAFDPWLHTVDQIERLTQELAPHGIALLASPNLVDAIWEDQPSPPTAKAFDQGIEFSGKSSADKRKEVAEALRSQGAKAAVITLPDSLCWLLNIRGADIPHTPVMHGFLILKDDASCELYAPLAKTEDVIEHLGPDVQRCATEDFLPALQSLEGPVLLDKTSVPTAIAAPLAAEGTEILYKGDPCALPKARKNSAEIEGSVAAHLRDGAAVANFLKWFDDKAETGISEIDVVKKLESFRSATNMLRDISFDTIAGTGSNGAVIHYRVTEETDRTLKPGEIMVLDSGGQYQDGTTDITRTLPIGQVGEEERKAFTLVLKGMIAMSKLRWPKGLAGRDLEAIARVPLWSAGLDFDHGVGHGVGSYLSVHEGPQRLSRLSTVPLEPGMILSNEPGYYREDAFGIRIENLIVVEDAPSLPGEDTHRKMLQFRTLTFVPIDQRLIDVDMLAPEEVEWLNAYHRACRDQLKPLVDAEVSEWLDQATAAI